MKDYTNSVKDSATSNINKRFANSSLEHAKLLTEELVKSANTEVCLLTDNFHDKFYSSVKPTLINFLDKPNTTLKVVIANNNSNTLNDLISEYPTQVLKKVIKLSDLPKDKGSNEYINYLINDTNGFRYEYSDKNLNDGIVEAIANFNSLEEREHLKNHFDNMFK